MMRIFSPASQEKEGSYDTSEYCDRGDIYKMCEREIWTSFRGLERKTSTQRVSGALHDEHKHSEDEIWYTRRIQQPCKTLNPSHLRCQIYSKPH